MLRDIMPIKIYCDIMTTSELEPTFQTNAYSIKITLAKKVGTTTHTYG